MRHQNGIKKIGRTGTHRRAMLRNLATSLFRHERIQTTELKAKELRWFADKLITLGKKGDLHARRLAARELHDHEVLSKLFSEIAGRMKERAGGYTRVLKLGIRRGDAAKVAMIELVDYKPIVVAPTEAAKAEKPVKAADKAEKPEKAPKAKAAKAAKPEGEKAAKVAKAKTAKAAKAEGEPAEKPAKKSKKAAATESK